MLVASDGHETSVVIRDVSAAGFRLEHRDDLYPGDRVSLRLDKGQTYEARIEWSLGNEAGGRFLDSEPAPDPA